MIILQRSDGGVSITEKITPKDIEKWEAAHASSNPAIDPLHGVTIVSVIESADIMSDRTFRNAWEVQGGKLTVSMFKARNLWRDKLRRARAPKLEALDVEYQRADERNDIAEKQRIIIEKQKLRDITADPRIESATTPMELKSILL